MGLLDDAIRDHLELKRLRGADPGEVAREQREALEPGAGGDPAAAIDELGSALEDVDAEADVATMPVRATPAATPTATGGHEAGRSPADGTELPNGGEETVELDMQTVMDEGEVASVEQASLESPVAPVGPARDAPLMDVPDGDQLEWEVPGESSGEPAADAHGRDPALDEDGR